VIICYQSQPGQNLTLITIFNWPTVTTGLFDETKYWP